MKKNISLTLSLFLAMSLFFTACSKDDINEGTPTTLNVMLTDAPADYDAVNIDLQEVRVKFKNDTTSEGWQSLTTNAGVYNLLAYQAGNDTLVAKGLITEETIQEIRLVLGENNSISVDGVIHPLTIPSGAESGLKLKISKDLTEPLETITIDFDALLSVKEQNGEYKLRPVLKIK